MIAYIKDFAFYQTPKEKLYKYKRQVLIVLCKITALVILIGYFLVYMVSFLFSTLLVLFAGAEDENVFDYYITICCNRALDWSMGQKRNCNGDYSYFDSVVFS